MVEFQNLNVKVLHDACTTHPHIETIFVQVKKGNTTLNVGVLYRPPNSVFKDFIGELERVFKLLPRI